MSSENEKKENETVNRTEQQPETIEDKKAEEIDNKEENNNKLQTEIDIKNKKIEQLESEIDGYKDRLLRKAAEFENYKRRTENDQLNLIKYAAENFLIKLLPTIDDFERSLQHMGSAKDVDSVRNGVQMIYEKFMKVLTDQGVVEIKSEGEPFNVAFHEALMQREVKDAAPHTVLDVVEKGYMYKDRVIRHAKVIVSDENSGNTETGDSNSNPEESK